jgi:hypothetical protein
VHEGGWRRENVQKGRRLATQAIGTKEEIGEKVNIDSCRRYTSFVT